MKVAVLADIHLPGRADTVKEVIFDWALRRAAEEKADLIAGAGDLTALGEIAAAERIVRKLEASGIPFILAHGNAELRSPEETAELLEIMKTPAAFGAVITVDSARGRLTGESSRFLRETAASEQRNLLLISHCPPAQWESDDQKILAELLEKRVVSRVVYGHSHIDIFDGTLDCIRGLDPDKASGGAPALVIFTLTSDGTWRREDIICPLAHAAEFPEAERRKIWDSIGISGMKTPVENLKLAIEWNLPVFEIRFSGVEEFPSDELLCAVGQWRQCGGKYLSLHMPDLKFDGENFSGSDSLSAAAEAAVRLGCDGVTLHVPRCFADELAGDDKIRRAAEAVSKSISLLFTRNISVGVENLHTNAAERLEKRYKFGCTGAECMAFINALRALNPGKKIGLHLDIGHARNNMPFSSRETLSDWYAGCGREIVAMHIHQVSRGEKGEFKNHTGFEDFYGMLISLSSLAMARRCGQIGDVPMILELRCPAEPTLKVLRSELLP